MPDLILASSSPQRRAILTQLGVDFEVLAPGVEELAEGEPEALVTENSRRKAAAVVAAGIQSSSDATPVLGVDTIVVLDGRIYGKPADVEQARATLEALRGREHQVLSGVCLIIGGETHVASSVTTVTFRQFGVPTLDWYLESGEWQGRAGGYAIQGRGAALVERINGDYLNVVGLPVATLLNIHSCTLFAAIS